MEQQENVVSAPLQRITVIDALRGFALLGVILMHMMQHYGIFSFGNTGDREALFPALDTAIRWLSQNVIMGKFINIFAFLFGLSFFIQMDRGARKGVDFRKRFIWRMVILFAIGMVGNCFYTGDILSIYAVFGVILVFLYRFKNWALLVLVGLLLIGTPRIVTTSYNQLTRVEQVSNSESSNQNRPQVRPQIQNPEEPSFLNSAKRNLTSGLEGKINYQFGLFGRGYLTFALFILGLIVGRLRFFEEVNTKRKRNLYLFGGFIFTLIALNFVTALLPQPENMRLFMRPGSDIPASALAIMALNDISAVVFSGALALGFILLYQIPAIGRCLNVMTPYGRMGLTNYEMQSVIGCFIFSTWAFGDIFGSWGPTEVFALGIVVYVAQIVASKYWMKYFLYGPLEWFWRSATYFKWQPFRKNKI